MESALAQPPVCAASTAPEQEAMAKSVCVQRQLVSITCLVIPGGLVRI